MSPQLGDELLLYLGVGDEAVSLLFIKEEGKKQMPIYYINQVLRGAELKYPIIEKLAFMLITTAHWLRPYF